MRVPRRALLAYALPGMPLAVLGLPLYVYLPTYYAEDLGIPLAVVGGVLLFARLVDTVSDPLIGFACDRWPEGGGRIAWMIAGGPLVVVGALQLFMPSADANATHLAVWSLVVYLGWSLMTLPYLALGAELSSDYHERSRVSAAREASIFLGTLLAIVVPALLESQGASRTDVLMWLAVLVAVLVPTALGTLLLAVREPARSKGVGFRAGWQLVRRNNAFRTLLFAYLANSVANGLPATLFLLFVAHVLQAEAWSGLLLALYLASAIVALPAWLWLARRIGKPAAWRVSMAWVSLVFASVPFLQSGDVTWFAVVCVLSGASLGADQALPASMQADVVDIDTAAGGGGRAGLYFGIWGMVTKLSLALAVGIAFPLLALFGFEPETGHSSPNGLLALSVMYAALPAGCKLFAIGLLRRYSIDERQQRDLQRRIQVTGGMQ